MIHSHTWTHVHTCTHTCMHTYTHFNHVIDLYHSSHQPSDLYTWGLQMFSFFPYNLRVAIIITKVFSTWFPAGKPNILHLLMINILCIYLWLISFASSCLPVFTVKFTISTHGNRRAFGYSSLHGPYRQI